MNSPNQLNISVRYRLAMTAVVLFAFAWRVQGLGRQSLWRDEVDSIYFALRDLPLTLSMFVQSADNGPLYFLSLRPWLQLFGTSEFSLRYPSVIFGVLSVPLLWQVSRRLMPGRADPADRVTFRALSRSMGAITTYGPLIAAIFLAINPYQLWYSQEGKMYSLATLLSLAAAWLWLQGIDRGGWLPWLGFLVTVSVAIYSHLFLILLIPLFFIWFLLAWPQSKHHWAGYLMALAGLLLPYVPMLSWQWPYLTSAEKLTAFDFIPLNIVLQSVALQQAIGIIDPVNLLWLAPFVLLGSAGLIFGFRVIEPGPEDPLLHLIAWRRHLLVVCWLVVPVLGIYLLSLRQPVFLPRYVIWIAPAIMMLLAMGVQVVRQYYGRVGRLLATLLFIYVLIFWGVIGWQEKTQVFKADLRGAIRYIEQRRDPHEVLILQFPYLRFAYSYYSSDQGTDPFAGGGQRVGRWVASGLWADDTLSYEEARRQADQGIRAAIGQATEVWVMSSEADLWDARGLMDEWLDQNGALLGEASFHEVQVHYYRLK